MERAIHHLALSSILGSSSPRSSNFITSSLTSSSLDSSTSMCSVFSRRVHHSYNQVKSRKCDVRKFPTLHYCKKTSCTREINVLECVKPLMKNSRFDHNGIWISILERFEPGRRPLVGLVKVSSPTRQCQVYCGIVVDQIYCQTVSTHVHNNRRARSATRAGTLG